MKTALIVLAVALTFGGIYKLWPASCLCEIAQRLEGKVAVVTDGAAFLGAEITAEFARRGAEVYFGCANERVCNEVVHKVLRMYGRGGERGLKEDFVNEEVKKHLTLVKESQLHPILVNLERLSTVKSFTDEIIRSTNRLDYLINNAILNHGPYHLTHDNFEATMSVGHLAQYYTTRRLTPLLKKTKPGATVVIVASAEHYEGSFEDNRFFLEPWEFNSVRGLAQVKLANVIHGVLLADAFKGTTVTPVSIHPGYVLPEMGVLIPSFLGVFFKTRWECAQAVLSAALTPNLQPGGYYSNCQLKEPSYEVKNETIVNWFKAETEKILKL